MGDIITRHAALVYTLLSGAFLLRAFFLSDRLSAGYLRMGLYAIGLHVGYKLLWMLTGGSQFELPIPFGLIFPPLLYLLAYCHYRQDSPVLRSTELLLGLPFLVYLALFAAATFLSPAEQTQYAKLYYVSSALSLLIHALLVVNLYSRYMGPPTSMDVLIRQLTMLCLGLVLLALMSLWEATRPEGTAGFDIRSLVFLFLGVGFALIGRYLLKKREKADAADMDAGSSLQVLAELIEKELQAGKLFLNPSVSLNLLAERTGIQRHQLTRVFNRHYRKSFYQFIAAARIEYAKTRIQEMEEQLTLDSLSYECGFNSKTSFNRYFKAHTGMTPSEYRSFCGQSVGMQ